MLQGQEAEIDIFAMPSPLKRSSPFSLSSTIKNIFSSSSERAQRDEKSGHMAVAKARYMLPEHLNASLIGGSLVKFVKQPQFVSRTEWLASHSIRSCSNDALGSV
jgi:hypothetical protein